MSGLVQRVLENGRANGLARSMVYSDTPDYVHTARFYERCGYRMWLILMTQFGLHADSDNAC